MKIDTTYIDATRTVSETEGRVTIWLWLDVPRADDDSVAEGHPVRLWVELEWEKKPHGTESLKVYEESVPPEWLKIPAYERRLKGRVKSLFEEAREVMFERGPSGTLDWAKEWMLSGKPARAETPEPPGNS